MKFQKLTPNLVVRDVAASMGFLPLRAWVPARNHGPRAASLRLRIGYRRRVEIFFNDQKAVAEDYPALGAKPIGGSLTLFIEVQGIEEVLAAVKKSSAKITMPLKQQFYGMREFAFEDPEGWVITIAEKLA
jgi:uncharacterized glyoxalase superfamily protein PhnB